MNTLVLIMDALVSLLLIVVAVPLLTGRVPPNRLYGIRFAKSLASPEDWYRINRYGAQQLIGWSGLGLAAVAVGFFLTIEEGSSLFWAYVMLPAITSLGACFMTLRYARTC